MINIKLRMSIEQIIFNLLNKNAHTWVRYWQQKEMSGLTMPGEYIEIRTFFLSGIELSDFFAAGFKINKIQSQKIDADAYCDILLNKTNIDRYAVEAGQTVHVKFDCSARQWENRWFNTLTAWEVTVIKAKEA